MNTELGQAYHTVQLSTKEMLKNNRRQHYCNMIDLLTSSCKASGLIATSFTDDELVQFWLGDILPLVFDSDPNIQTCAICAVAEALVSLDVHVIHTSKEWPAIRSDFINKYIKEVDQMRDAKNSNWHKIWTLLVQIMDEELLRGCTYINKFLSVVELGFRSQDNGIRSEAFLCWRVLIKVFTAYNELAVPKRMRLLLIPLRTSQSRSSHVSSIKVRVWWYLLTCIDADLHKSFETSVEHFLTFLFGSGPNGNIIGLAETFQVTRELAIPCLVALWNIEFSEPLHRIMRDLRLETLLSPSPLTDPEVLQKHWRPMLASATAAIELMCQANALEAEHIMLDILLRNVTVAMFKLRSTLFAISFCNEIIKVIPSNSSVGRSVFNTFYTESLVMNLEKDANCLDALEACMKLSVKARTGVPSVILQRCMPLMFSMEQLTANDQNEFRLLTSFAELLMQSNDDEDYESFGVKLNIWRQVTAALLCYLRENTLEYRLTSNASLLDNWILWPLNVCAGFAGRRVNTVFDAAFCEQWRQLLLAGQNAPERKKFMGEIKTALCELISSSKDEPMFPELFDAYATAVMKQGICKDAPLHKDIFAVLTSLYEMPTLSQRMIEGCLNTLRNIILEMRQNELIVVFDALKPILATSLQSWKKHKCEGSFLSEWKRAIQDKFRQQPMKSMATQLKDLFKGDDLFVIIPSVWSLNPEKLTDRQKERFAEKRDIPALYNDMSQSQDSIKPWTPKKVVIAKSKEAEVAICGKDNDLRDPIVIENTEPVVVLEPRRQRSQSTCIEVDHIEKYNFRKSPRALPEEESQRVATVKEETPVRITRNRLAQKESGNERDETFGRQLRSPKKAQLRQNEESIKSSTQKSEPTAEDPKATPAQSQDLFSEAASTQLTDLQRKLSSAVVETQMSAPSEALVETPTGFVADPMEIQESSPKKPVTRQCNLNSPPDRKQTNNSSSPTLRPKPSAHLTGRGAQLINMIRNKKLDGNSPFTLPAAASAATSRAQLTPARIFERSELVSTPTTELNELTGTDQTSTPIQPKELLTFSKRLPSPSASPSVSILKRKFRCESVDEISMESPAMKRKRVSFHDPPVSVTKEYLRDTEENRSKPKRCLLLDKIAQTSEIKSALKRRGRLDSFNEIEKFAKEQTARSAATDKLMEKSNEIAEDEAFISLKWNETTTNNSIGSKSSTSTAANVVQDADPVEPPSEHGSRRDLSIMDSDTALDLVVEQCSLDSVLERYFSKANCTPLKSANILAKFLSSQMGTNPKLKSNVLETLSENHCKDFLDHAVRENLSSVVCDRLNPNSVLDYICAKSKINSSCRSNLLAQLPGILKTSRLESERLQFVQELLLQCDFSDEQLLDIIGRLMRARDNRKCNTEMVAESAADSSSNL